MTSEHRRLSEKIEEFEQHMRSNNLEIKDMPEQGEAHDISEEFETF